MIEPQQRNAIHVGVKSKLYTTTVLRSLQLRITFTAFKPS